MPKSASRRVCKPTTTAVVRSKTRTRAKPSGKDPSANSRPFQRPDAIYTGGRLERISAIHARLRRHERINSVTLAREHDVTSMTIKRDLDVMRYRLGMPIQWDEARHTYYYTHDCETLPFVVLGTRDALVLGLAGRIVEACYGSAFGDHLDGVLQKIGPVLGGAVTFTAAELDQVVAPPAAALTRDAADEFEHFFVLFDAIRERRAVRLLYTKRERDEAEERLVQPLRLARRHRDQRWLLVAFDPVLAGLRKFLLGRIQELTPTRTPFDPPAGLDVDTYLRASLDAFAGEQVEEVRVALDERAAFYAREQPWHPSQRLRDLPDGRVELTIRVNDLPGAKNLVLHWAEHVEVLAPATLRTEVREAHRTALARYDCA